MCKECKEFNIKLDEVYQNKAKTNRLSFYLKRKVKEEELEIWGNSWFSECMDDFLEKDYAVLSEDIYRISVELSPVANSYTSFSFPICCGVFYVKE